MTVLVIEHITRTGYRGVERVDAVQNGHVIVFCFIPLLLSEKHRGVWIGLSTTILHPSHPTVICHSNERTADKWILVILRQNPVIVRHHEPAHHSLYKWKIVVGSKPTTTWNMKLFLILVSLFAAAQAQFTIRAPAPGTTLQADEAVTIQVVVPVDTVSYTLRYMMKTIYLSTHLERRSRTRGNQPRNWHGRLWIIGLSSTICRPGSTSLCREISTPRRDSHSQ